MPTYQFNITTRLILSFATVLLVMAAITAVALWRLQAAYDMTDYLVNRKLATQQLAADWLGAVSLNSVRAIAIAKSDSLELEEYFASQLSVGDKEIAVLRTALQGSAITAEETALLAAIDLQRSRYLAVRTEVFKLKSIGKTQDVEQQVKRNMEPAQLASLQGIRQVLDNQKIQAKQIADDSERLYRTSILLLIGLGVLSIALGVLCAWLLIRSLVRPLRHAIGIAAQVASGDLAIESQPRRGDEVGALLMSLEQMAASLAGTVGNVRHGIVAMDATAQQMSIDNVHLSDRTVLQAESLQDAASSIEQLSAAVRQNAASALQANGLATSAADNANQGGQQIGQLVTTMTSIAKSSARMGDIIGVIDGIAFQTNILALNAAVEAARAGDHGRGFAVVAAEVRALAQRSAAAAREIKALIQQSVDCVTLGSRHVHSAGQTIDAIVTSSREVATIVGQITDASHQQHIGIEQVNLAVAEIDAATQQNAALVREAAANAAELQRQSQQLRAAIGFFSAAQTGSAPLRLAA
ncbi:methyl-accepting chemotaxis protein [Actimicrobium antarcticum]|uniref:Methyl-accepting chemotaxis protein n=1 Tax=Actimicrobium antarcticum TaxID=1051899 RepID=A0ABP7T3P5_9BURK